MALHSRKTRAYLQQNVRVDGVDSIILAPQSVWGSSENNKAGQKYYGRFTPEAQDYLKRNGFAPFSWGNYPFAFMAPRNPQTEKIAKGFAERPENLTSRPLHSVRKLKKALKKGKFISTEQKEWLKPKFKQEALDALDELDQMIRQSNESKFLEV